MIAITVHPIRECASWSGTTEAIRACPAEEGSDDGAVAFRRDEARPAGCQGRCTPCEPRGGAAGPAADLGRSTCSMWWREACGWLREWATSVSADKPIIWR
jgi:hypothetical protein